MTTKDTGGPAFPCDRHATNANNGMTLRDYFAAKAMQTFLGSEYTSEHGLTEGWMKSLSRESYLVADAMLAERNKQ